MERWRGLQYAREVLSRKDFDAFLEVLYLQERKPVVAISIAEGASAPAADVVALEDRLQDSVHLYILHSEVTFWLTDALGGKALSVHSGWARVYPSAGSWLTAPQLAPKFSPAPPGSRRAIDRIVEAALTAAFRDGYASRPEVSATAVRTTVRVVDVVSPTQAVVVDSAGRQALLRTNSLLPGLIAERVVTPGQTFDGVISSVGLLGEFMPDLLVDDPDGRVAEFVADGVVTLALAVNVSPDRVRLLVHPQVGVDILGGGDDDLTNEVTEGEVVVVEIVEIEGEFLASFSADEPRPAISALPGGPPWIVPDAAKRVADAAPDTAAPAPSHGHRDDDYAGALLIDEIARLEDAVATSQATIKELRRQIRHSRRFRLPVVHSDPERQFRLEMELSYLVRVDETRRSELAWPERFRLGPNFIASVDELVGAGGITRQKIVDVCAEVVCGLARELPSRGVKEWGSGGGKLARHDGAVAMRVRLQSGTSAARRLRYWKLPSGEIELDRVCLHDDEI